MPNYVLFAGFDAAPQLIPPELRHDPKGGVLKGRSQIDMAFDILKEAAHPLHISELLLRIRARFGNQVDRESLVSALTKRVARADRFVRTDKNTFGLRQTAR
jgi:HB1/ASXL restriction endonuclease-like protein with HTH domain